MQKCRRKACPRIERAQAKGQARFSRARACFHIHHPHDAQHIYIDLLHSLTPIYIYIQTYSIIMPPPPPSSPPPPRRLLPTTTKSIISSITITIYGLLLLLLLSSFAVLLPQRKRRGRGRGRGRRRRIPSHRLTRCILTNTSVQPDLSQTAAVSSHSISTHNLLRRPIT